jgi:tRNA A37 threonylcarbamoyladenosine modification protein TsaB
MVMGYSNPALRERIKNRIMAGSKGGNPGQWSARKAQLLAQEYEKSGGKYTGSKTTAQKSLSKWTKEKWGTKSGKPSLKTGERYLPKKARESLSSKEYAATSRAKREGMKQGKQFVSQPKKIAKKTAKYR